MQPKLKKKEKNKQEDNPLEIKMALTMIMKILVEVWT